MQDPAAVFWNRTNDHKSGINLIVDHALIVRDYGINISYHYLVMVEIVLSSANQKSTMSGITGESCCRLLFRSDHLQAEITSRKNYSLTQKEESGIGGMPSQGALPGRRTQEK
jgi:hypothetical protein